MQLKMYFQQSNLLFKDKTAEQNSLSIRTDLKAI